METSIFTGEAASTAGTGATVGNDAASGPVGVYAGEALRDTGTVLTGSGAKQADQAIGDKATESGSQVPASPEGYVLAAPEGMETDSSTLSHFTTVAHANGLSQGQAEALVGMYSSLVSQKQEEAEKRALATEQAWLSDMKREAGFAQTVHHARLAVERFGTEELSTLLDQTRLGSHPALVRFVAAIGKELAEPSALPGRTGGTGGKLNFYETMT